MVDVQHARDRYARAIAWSGRHVSGLDRWISRAGIDAQQGQHGGLTLPSRSIAALGADAGTAMAGGVTESPVRHNVVAPAVRDAALPGGIHVPISQHARSRHAESALPRVSRQLSHSSPDLTTTPTVNRRGVEVHVGPPMRAVPLARTHTTQISRTSSPVEPSAPVPGGQGAPEIDTGQALPRVEAASAIERARSPQSAFADPDPSSGDSRSVSKDSTPHTATRDANVGPPIGGVRSSAADLPLISRSTLPAGSAAIQRQEESGGTQSIASEPPAAVPASTAPAEPSGSAAATAAVRATEVVAASAPGRPPFPSSHVLVQRRLRASDSRTPANDGEISRMTSTPAAPVFARAGTTVAPGAAGAPVGTASASIRRTVASTDTGTDAAIARRENTVAAAPESMEAARVQPSHLAAGSSAMGTVPVVARHHDVVPAVAPSSDAARGTDLPMVRRRVAEGAPSTAEEIDPLRTPHGATAVARLSTQTGTAPITAQRHAVVAPVTPSIEAAAVEGVAPSIAPASDRPSLPSTVARATAAPHRHTELTVARRRTAPAIARSLDTPAAMTPEPGAAVVSARTSSIVQRSLTPDAPPQGYAPRPAEEVPTVVDAHALSIPGTGAAAATPGARVESPVPVARAASPVIQRSPAAAPSEIVWRQAGALRTVPVMGDARRTAAAFTPAISRAFDPGSHAIDRGSEGPASLATAPDTASGTPESARMSGPDLMEIVDQVTNRILRQIAVERERRGSGRWPS